MGDGDEGDATDMGTIVDMVESKANKLRRLADRLESAADPDDPEGVVDAAELVAVELTKSRNTTRSIAMYARDHVDEGDDE